MIKTKIQIGAEAARDSYEQYGFIYISSDHRVAADTKGFESTAYPEEEGEHVLAKTVDAPFDYKVTFLVLGEQKGSTIQDMNSRIAAFNTLLYSQSGDTKEFKTITFFNPYKKQKIVGIPTPIAMASEYWRDSAGKTFGAAQVELTIRVTKPSLCDFNYSE